MTVSPGSSTRPRARTIMHWGWRPSATSSWRRWVLVQTRLGIYQSRSEVLQKEHLCLICCRGLSVKWIMISKKYKSFDLMLFYSFQSAGVERISCFFLYLSLKLWYIDVLAVSCELWVIRGGLTWSTWHVYRTYMFSLNIPQHSILKFPFFCDLCTLEDGATMSSWHKFSM